MSRNVQYCTVYIKSTVYDIAYKFIQPPRRGGGVLPPETNVLPLREDHQLHPPQGRSTCCVIVVPLFWVAFVGDDVVAKCISN